MCKPHTTRPPPFGPRRLRRLRTPHRFRNTLVGFKKTPWAKAPCGEAPGEGKGIGSAGVHVEISKGGRASREIQPRLAEGVHVQGYRRGGGYGQKVLGGSKGGPVKQGKAATGSDGEPPFS